MTKEELEEIEERRFQAFNLLGELAVSGRLKRSTPAQDSDEDMILVGPLLDVPKLLAFIYELEKRIPRWTHTVDKLPDENEEVLFAVFDPTTQIFQGYIRNGVLRSDFFEGPRIIGPWLYWMPLLEGLEEK